MDKCPCEECDRKYDPDCNGWDAMYCCKYCRWSYGDAEPPCDDCPWEIKEQEGQKWRIV